jgi:prepilin-type processing-associated H-X9-DG protein
MLVAASITVILAVLLAGTGRSVYRSSSLAISAGNIRQLSSGGAAYLAENNYVFWKYREDLGAAGTLWWFGAETRESQYFTPEGERRFDPSAGPLAGYIPSSLRPDPSFSMTGKAFKPKYKNGYLGIGYNTLFYGANESYWRLPKPGEIVVFATSAQVNTFQPPASSKKPMVEEYYGITATDVTVHFRHGGSAMVGFADGSCGFLPMDKSTLDSRAPQAAIGRFAPLGSTKYLLPESPP